MLVACIRTPTIHGDILVTPITKGVRLTATFSKLPPGKHGFHIHKAGDLRGEGCAGLCEHYDIGSHSHGDGPHSKGERHTGDLGNIEILPGKSFCKKTYTIHGTSLRDLVGRSIIVHEDEDDLGLGTFEDSAITGHSGKRIGCAIFGVADCKQKIQKTRKMRKMRKTRKM